MLIVSIPVVRTGGPRFNFFQDKKSSARFFDNTPSKIPDNGWLSVFLSGKSPNAIRPFADCGACEDDLEPRTSRRSFRETPRDSNLECGDMSRPPKAQSCLRTPKPAVQQFTPQSAFCCAQTPS
jgi:hypothetical protein